MFWNSENFFPFYIDTIICVEIKLANKLKR
jgi:hypothetical protein